ncbi:unnamed protein product [Effrenium voratum]|uniref:Uncharacterized protein n=1 Tax=Effrenium voratum TaxID=2562239 RepID=A0AA36IM95_9DINO|nr:unnamed protein product [Effrenium voratum]
MTGVHASMPALQLSCYLRVYCGRHQPTGELMLEPILWEPGEEPPVKATVETQTETTQEDVPPPKPRGDWPRAPPEPPTDSAMFPAEIRLGRDASEQIEEEVIVVAPQPQAPAEGPTPALPLVSQLVRELMQLADETA